MTVILHFVTQIMFGGMQITKLLIMQFHPIYFLLPPPCCYVLPQILQTRQNYGSVRT